MKFMVYDVGHGFCAALFHENGNTMLWDAGHSGGSRPSRFLPLAGVRSIQKFFISNYDEDHISGLPALRSNLSIESLTRNNTISPQQLRQLKLQGGPISSAMSSLIEMMELYTEPVIRKPAFPGIDFSVYYNAYRADFLDTNNISLVTFLFCRAVNVIIPGDLESPAWKKLLERDEFRRQLQGVEVFIASHHGRESGYCKEVFDYCRPRVVVFPDSAIRYASQKMASTYASHASGVPFKGKTRYVLTTRNDGTLQWES